MAAERDAVAVIGGGWAGCAAALTLAEAGVPVTLYEAGRTLGGRARAVELDGRALDNGHHLLLGAYAQTLQCIERMNGGGAHAGLWRLPLTLDLRPDFALTCPRLPAPLHLLAGLLAARGLGWRDKLAAARWVRSALDDYGMSDARSVGELTRGQPETLNRLLWHPLCIAALNTPPDQACARTFCNVLRAAFGGSNRHSDLLLPRRDLTALFPAPAADRVTELGGQVRVACRVRTLAESGDAVALVTDQDGRAYRKVIVAVAPQHLPALVSGVPALAALAHQVRGYIYQPIATGYVQYDAAFQLPRPMLGLSGGPAQFVFDRGASHGQPGLLAFVASAAADLSRDWLDHAETQLRRSQQPGTARWRRSIVEKQATFACLPGMDRPGATTAHPRIFLAGDYVAGPYPATLESATLSGVQSARTVLEQL